MSMQTISLLVVYFAIILIILAFLSLFFIHIKPYRQFLFGEKYIFMVFFAIIAVITVFGAYKIITGIEWQPPENAFNISNNTRFDF